MTTVAKEAIQAATTEAVKTVGGMKSLAKALNVSYQAVQKWLKTGVPPARVRDVEKVSGVSRHRLRPDIYGPNSDAA